MIQSLFISHSLTQIDDFFSILKMNAFSQNKGEIVNEKIVNLSKLVKSKERMCHNNLKFMFSKQVTKI